MPALISFILLQSAIYQPTFMIYLIMNDANRNILHKK
jgi:hypothetical protein